MGGFPLTTAEEEEKSWKEVEKSMRLHRPHSPNCHTILQMGHSRFSVVTSGELPDTRVAPRLT